MANVRAEESCMLPTIPTSKGYQKYDINSDNIQTKKRSWYGVRHTQFVLLFTMVAIGYGMRINLSVGIVAMTDKTVNPDFPTYDWPMSTKSNVLSAFFWGYVVTQLFSGRLAELYGPKWFLFTAVIVSSFFTALIPILAKVGPWAVFICRIIQGAAQGFFFPSIQYLLGKWAPLGERSRMASLVYSGGPLGTVICMPLTGWISASSFGWPSVFYLYAVHGVIWSLLWLWMGSNSPSEHKTISEEEKGYIQEKLSADDENSGKKYPTPYKHIIKSLPFWGILIAFSGQNWGFWTLMTEIPTYMSGVLNFDIKQNGLLSAAPYLALWILSFFFSTAADFLINRKILSIAATRKLASAIALIGPAIALFILGVIDKPDRTVAVTLLIIAVAINAAVFSGHQVNHIEIAPTHAAQLMGLTNGIGNIFSVMAPFVVQYIVIDEKDPNQWKMVFFIAAGIYVAADIFYTCVGKGDVQYWDKLEEDKLKDGVKYSNYNSLEITSR